MNGQKMILFVIGLLLISPVYAGWETTAELALITSVGILGITYMLGMAFTVPELIAVAKEELMQVVALGVMIALFFGTNGLINSISTNQDLVVQAHSTTLQQAAKSQIDSAIGGISGQFNIIAENDQKVSTEASSASSCSIMGTGYTVSYCGGFTMLASPLSMSGSAVGFAIGELSAIKRLIAIAEAAALPLLLPAGIILRTFKLTRGAGGLLIAVAISMHILLPLGVLFNEIIAKSFFDSTDPLVASYKNTPTTLDISCSDAASLIQFQGTGEKNAVEAYSALRGDIKKYLYQIIVRGTVGPILSLIIMTMGIRSISALAGSEIDITPISRFI